MEVTGSLPSSSLTVKATLLRLLPPSAKGSAKKLVDPCPHHISIDDCLRLSPRIWPSRASQTQIFWSHIVPLLNPFGPFSEILPAQLNDVANSFSAQRNILHSVSPMSATGLRGRQVLQDQTLEISPLLPVPFLPDCLLDLVDSSLHIVN